MTQRPSILFGDVCASLWSWSGKRLAQKVEGGAMRLAAESKQPAFHRSVKTRSCGRSAKRTAPEQNRSVQQPAGHSAARPAAECCRGPGMNDLSAEGEACRQLMELDVTATEGGRRRGRTDRKLEQMETLTSSYFVM